ncbi:hypothetical protein FACS1894161_0800 [Spirochaetia bacterium]|nr:hypothetical protein FACS1894161_0800 [Spirochaetia bacterium]
MAIGDTVSGLGEKVKSALSQFAELVHSHLLIAALSGGALFIIFALLIVLAVVRHLPPKAPPQRGAGDAFRQLTVSPDDFFMPGEPNFVPDVILGREPRSGWSEEDARPFWADPMEEDADTWKQRVESAMDALLERVP